MGVILSQFAGAGAQFFDNSGNVLTGGKIYSYQAGTTTPVATYTTFAGNINHPNPIILDASGRVPSGGEIWLLEDVNYKFILRDANDVLIATYDNINSLYNGTALANTSDPALGDALVGFRQSDSSGNLPNSVGRTVHQKLQEFVNVKDFGAVGDGVTDDTAAIQAALDYCNTYVRDEYKAKLIGAPGTYKVSNTLTISCDCDLSAMKIIANAAVVSPVIRVGGTLASQITWYKQIVLPKVENDSRPAGLFGSGVGVQLTNCNTCNITVPAILFFETGLSCGGFSQGFAYNTVFLQYILQNKVNVNVGTNNLGGWANQNVFIGGRLAFTTSFFSGTTNAGTRNIVIGNTNGQANNNIFINTSIEGETFPEYSIEFRQKTAYNQFQSCRYEGVAGKKVLFNTDEVSGNNSNLIIGGYQADQIVYTFTGTGSNSYNCAINGRRNFIESTGVGFSIKTGGGDQPHIQGFSSADSALGKSSTATDWQYRLAETNFLGKDDDDTEARLRLTWTTSNGRVYFGDGTVEPTTYITGNENAFSFSGYTNVRPLTNNTTGLGQAGYRWSEVFAVNGTINTSDAREKQQIRTLSEQEHAVALRCKSLLRAYKWNDAVHKKGDKARIHFGIIAQDLADAFKAEGLDPDQYSMFCYDKWEAEYEPEIATRMVERVDENGEKYIAKEEYKTGKQVIVQEAGDSYGVRYSELLAFMIAAL